MTDGTEIAVKSQVADAMLVKRRRSRILAAAVELFSEQGFYRATMQEVARKAGVSIGLIYQYVQDKDDVLLFVLLSVLDSYRREIPAALEGVTDPLTRCWVAVDAYCRVVDSRRKALLAYRSIKSLPKERRRLIMKAQIETNRFIADCLRDCVKRRLFRPMNVELATYHFVLFAHGWALKHWRLRELCTLDDYIENGLDLLLRAMLTPQGARQYARMRARLKAGNSGPRRWRESRVRLPARPSPRGKSRKKRLTSRPRFERLFIHMNRRSVWRQGASLISRRQPRDRRPLRTLSCWPRMWRTGDVALKLPCERRRIGRVTCHRSR
jgi:AcrR family transcriptional regulator